MPEFDSADEAQRWYVRLQPWQQTILKREYDAWNKGAVERGSGLANTSMGNYLYNVGVYPAIEAELGKTPQVYMTFVEQAGLAKKTPEQLARELGLLEEQIKTAQAKLAVVTPKYIPPKIPLKIPPVVSPVIATQKVPLAQLATSLKMSDIPGWDVIQNFALSQDTLKQANIWTEEAERLYPDSIVDQLIYTTRMAVNQGAYDFLEALKIAKPVLSILPIDKDAKKDIMAVLKTAQVGTKVGVATTKLTKTEKAKNAAYNKYSKKQATADVWAAKAQALIELGDTTGSEKAISKAVSYQNQADDLYLVFNAMPGGTWRERKNAILDVVAPKRRKPVKLSFKEGGEVKDTGLYLLHEGEEVIPHTPITTQKQYKFFRAELSKPISKRLTKMNSSLLQDHITEYEAAARGDRTPQTSSRKESNMKKGSKEAKAWGAKMRRARNAGKTKRKTSTKTASSKKTKRRASTASRTEYIT